MGPIGRYRFALVFVIVMAVLFVVIEREGDISKEDTRALCDTTNSLVVELNNRIPAHKADTKGLIDFLEGAKAAREAAFTRTEAKEDQKAALTYGEIVEFVEANVSYSRLTPIDCERFN